MSPQLVGLSSVSKFHCLLTGPQCQTQGKEATPEFFTPSHAPFTPQYPVGSLTCFAEQTMIYARSLAEQGKVDPEAIVSAYTAYYSAPANTSRGYPSYYDQATKKFLANIAAGKKWPHTGDDDAETNAVAHVLPVVVMRAGKPGFLADAEAAIRVVQDNDEAVAFGLLYARILEKVILGSTIVDAIRETATTLKTGTTNPNDPWLGHGLTKMDEWAPRPPLDVTLEVGQSCDYPNNAFTAPHLLFHHAAAGVSFEEAIRETIKNGGENANRGSFIGSLLAAEAGSVSASVPSGWLNKTLLIKEIMTLGETLAGANSTTTEPAMRPHRVAAVAAAAASKRSRRSGVTYPQSNPDDVKALVALYHSAGGAGWDESGNWLNTHVSVCEWDRVVCDETTGRVTILRFLGNQMDGTLPDEIGLLTSMVELHLGWNPGLRGAIPPSISQMKALERLYVWNASLTSVPEELGLCSALIAIDLTDNRLEGPLPSTLKALKNVDTAYFDGNPKLPCPVPPAVDTWLRTVKYHAPPCKS